MQQSLGPEVASISKRLRGVGKNGGFQGSEGVGVRTGREVHGVSGGRCDDHVMIEEGSCRENRAPLHIKTEVLPTTTVIFRTLCSLPEYAKFVTRPMMWQRIMI